MLIAQRRAQIQAIDMFVHGHALNKLRDQLEKQSTEFDAIDFVGLSRFGSGANLWGDEEFQSNVLGWLLDANQTHTAGVEFISSFLSQTGAPQKLLEADWTQALVVREWENVVDGRQGFLDILVLNEQQSALCAIENKVFSSEHSCQLTRYRTALESRYPLFEKHYVFLTPNGTCPYRAADRQLWKPIAYSTVLKEVQRIVDNGHTLKDEGVRLFLKQYATTLRRNIVQETSIPQMARKIYLEHREIIELIYKHKPHYANESKQIFKEAVSQLEGWRLEAESANWIRFRPTSWANLRGMETGTGDGSPNLLVFFQFYFSANYPTLGLWLSPGKDDALRQKLVDCTDQHPTVFNNTGRGLNAGWTNLHRVGDILNDTDLSNWDNPSVRAKIEAWVKNFAENEFPAMNDVIVNCLREYEAEQNGG